MFLWLKRLSEWLKLRFGHKKTSISNEKPARIDTKEEHSPLCRVMKNLYPEKTPRARNEEIAKRNLQRQQNTLGHGIRGKFRPRPAFEKKLWKLDKKPEENN